MDSEINAKVADAGIADSADISWQFLWLAAYFVICLIFWRRAVKQEKGMPPAVCPDDGFGWQRGDVLASAGDWWRWQVYACLTYMLFVVVPMMVVFVANMLAAVMGRWDEFVEVSETTIDIISYSFSLVPVLFGAGVFLYFGVQRVVAAGKRLWLFVMFVVAMLFGLLDYVANAAGDASLHLEQIIIIMVKIYIGTLRNAEPRAEPTGDNRAAAA